MEVFMSALFVILVLAFVFFKFVLPIFKKKY